MSTYTCMLLYLKCPLPSLLGSPSCCPMCIFSEIVAFWMNSFGSGGWDVCCVEYDSVMAGSQDIKTYWSVQWANVIPWHASVRPWVLASSLACLLSMSKTTVREFSTSGTVLVSITQVTHTQSWTSVCLKNGQADTHFFLKQLEWLLQSPWVNNV